MKIDPYYQRQKCSAGIAVSSKIRFMRIFTGVRWRGGFKWEWGSPKWRFSLILPGISSEPSHLKPKLLYYAMYSHSGSSVTPKYMTLNDLGWPFCAKICFGLGNLCVAASGFRAKLCENLKSYLHCQRQNCSPGILVSSKVRLMWIIAGVCWWGGVKWEWGGRK